MKYTINKEHICEGVIYMQILHKNDIIAEGRTVMPNNNDYQFTDVYYLLNPHKRDKIIKTMQKSANEYC